MGLFDLNQQQTQGLLAAASQMLQQSGPSRTPSSFGQIMGGGLAAYQQQSEMARRQKLEEEQAKQMAEMRAQQMQMGQLDLAHRQRGDQQEIDMQGAYREAGGDVQKLVEAVSRVNPVEGMKLRQQMAKQAPKFDTKPQVGIGEDGKPFTYILAEDGTQRRLDGTLPRDEMKLANLGGKDMAYNPFALQAGQTFQRTQTPDSIASTASAAASRAQADRHFNASFGLAKEKAALDASAVKTPKMTEDQGKATGWLIQAENAYKNLQAVGMDKDGNVTAAARPGVADVIAGMPGLAGFGNSLRSPSRQKFNQAASSMSEAFLRAATGAGVNKDEALQKVQEITPVWGEPPEVTKQKFDSIPLYIESLKVRAGAGANLATGVLGAHKPAAPGGAKFLGFE